MRFAQVLSRSRTIHMQDSWQMSGLERRVARKARKWHLLSFMRRWKMADPIEHVIVLMMENHSFDQLLGGLSVAIPDLDGVNLAAPAGIPDYPDTTQLIRQQA